MWRVADFSIRYRSTLAASESCAAGYSGCSATTARSSSQSIAVPFAPYPQRSTEKCSKNPSSGDTERDQAHPELGRGPPVRPMQPGVQEYCTMGRGCSMAIETTYTSLRQNLANVLDQIVDQQETVVVRRRGARDVALIPAAELAGLIETAHLLRSPRNARRLLAALRRAEQGKTKPVSVAVLRREMLGATGKKTGC